MDIEYAYIYDLIAKSLTGELTEEETVYLNDWKTADKANTLEYNEFKEIWEHSKRLSQPSGINLAKSLAVTRKKAGIVNGQVKWLPVFIQIAAVLILALLFSAFYNQFLTQKPNEKIESTVYQSIKAPYGTQSRIELSDGTVVYLNSGSTLRFPNSFNGQKNRNVELSGEGHFSVAKNSEQPFIVDIKKLQIKVTGTTFNVSAYADNAVITIALVEGSIKLQQNSGKYVADLVELKPNQVAYYKPSENNLKVKTEDDLNKYTAWTEGKLVFSNDPINMVIQKLGNWYNVNIELTDKNLEKYRFTGTFIDEPLEQVLSILNLTSRMEYKVIPAQKLSDNSYSKRKIILKSK